LTPRALAALRAVAATLVEGGAEDLAERVAGHVAALPRAAERAELDLLLRLFESRVVNLLIAGIPRRFSAMTPAQRQRYLRGWATSRLPPRRKAFQALKRLVTVTHYTTPGMARTIDYPGPPGPAPNTPKPIRPLAVTTDTTLTCDVVVVGSGAGGGVVAAELAARGKDVIVLEKGGYHNEADFTQQEGDGLERLYDAGGLLATRDLSLVILQGATLGGGTVVNYTTSFATPQSVREEWAREHGLPHFTGSEFTRSLDAAARRIGVNTDHAAPSGRDRVLIRGLERLGWHHGLLPRNVRGCTQDDACGYCGYGCRAAAKQSTLVTYLPDAVAHGARIVVDCDARRVVITGGAATGVEARVRGHRLTVRAGAVVVACGSIHSPALLLRSGVSLPALGRFLALHPATAVFAEMDEAVRPWTGTLQAHYSDQFADLDQGYGFKFETAPVHPSLLALAAPWESATQYADRMARLARTALCGILLRDRFGGRVRVDRDGCPVVDYQVSRYDAVHLRRALASAAELLEAAGAREIWPPLARWISYKPGTPRAREEWLARIDAAGWGANQLLLVTFHQMASCRMGASARSSVVDPEHRVWGVRGLYVADASVFPTASGVNPMLTIMGIAHRAAQLIDTH
jgi:choline dehydrogenase-like flavoprotein